MPLIDLNLSTHAWERLYTEGNVYSCS